MLSCVLGAMIFALWVTLFPLIFVIWRGDGGLWRAGGSIAGAMMVLLPLPAFVMLVVVAVEVVFNLRRYQAVLIGLFSLSSLIALPLLMSAATTLCASPLLLLFLLFLLRDRIDDLMGASRSREAFRRSLEFATLNPADASAHYNLGLLYLERGERAEAEWSFRKAIEVDARETDAYYQLGRIAREAGRLTVALQHFERVIEQDPAHSHHEIWREVGQLYYAAGQYDDALAMLDRFQHERPSDGEGRYWRGMVLDRLNRRQEAIAEMRECVEAVRSAPAYKYRAEKQWLARAEEFLRERK
jgi:tetratricopeptide (TPR) repeat protein